MERRGRGDVKGKKGVKEGGNKTLTALVWGQDNDFHFKHLLPFMIVTDDTSQLVMSELKAVVRSNTTNHK